MSLGAGDAACTINDDPPRIAVRLTPRQPLSCGRRAPASNRRRTSDGCCPSAAPSSSSTCRSSLAMRCPAWRGWLAACLPSPCPATSCLRLPPGSPWCCRKAVAPSGSCCAAVASSAVRCRPRRPRLWPVSCAVAASSSAACPASCPLSRPEYRRASDAAVAVSPGSSRPAYRCSYAARLEARCFAPRRCRRWPGWQRRPLLPQLRFWGWYAWSYVSNNKVEEPRPADGGAASTTQRPPAGVKNSRQATCPRSVGADAEARQLITYAPGHVGEVLS